MLQQNNKPKKRKTSWPRRLGVARKNSRENPPKRSNTTAIRSSQATWEMGCPGKGERDKTQLDGLEMSENRTIAKQKRKRTGDNSREETAFKKEDVNIIHDFAL